ncbi:MAG TPA: hypothetical protein VJZ71_21515 [Phycisphaerae bacterium]|nr:hypothetical protein [Phycisphaerae bacterium]
MKKCTLWSFAMTPAICLAWTGDAKGSIVLWSSLNGGNDHYYERVDDLGLTWDQARVAAENRTYSGVDGYLATITSAAENGFIINNLGGAALIKYSLGGFQISESQEPAGGWQWVTGEPWSYTNWAPGEPNNSGPFGPESALTFRGDVNPAIGLWNDVTQNHPLDGGYVVEYPTPEPATFFMMCALVVTIRRRPMRK